MTEIVVRQKDEKELVEKISTMQQLVENCPDPTQEELRKLLAIQGTILNQIGIDLLFDAKQLRRPLKQINVALKALAASREALTGASRVKVKEADSQQNLPADTLLE